MDVSTDDDGDNYSNYGTNRRLPATITNMRIHSTNRKRQRQSSCFSGERIQCHLPTRRLGMFFWVLVVMFHTQACSFAWTWTNHHHHQYSGGTQHRLPPFRCNSRRWASTATTSSSSSFPTPGTPAASNNNHNNINYGGLSKSHRSILTRTADRQRFVTGRYPVTVQITENPTRKWLHQLGRRGESAPAVTELLVNGTAPARSLASFGRFQWLDEDERNDLYNVYSMVSIELQAEIHTERPGYLHILPANGAGSSAATYRQVESQESSTSIGAWERWKKRVPSFVDLAELQEEDLEFAVPHHDRLWVTGFSLAGRQGLVKYVDATAEDCRISSVNKRTAQAMLWPNEVHPVPANLLRTICDAASSIGSNGSTAPGTTDDARSSATSSRNEPYQDALLVCDGFLVPGKDRGGIYVVKNPGNPQTEWTVSLTAATATATATHGANKDDRWFYHRAAWVDLTGDGRQSILTARARVSTRLSRSGSNNNSNTTSANNAGVTTGITKTGELVWLEMPKPHSIDRRTGTPLESDGTIFDPFSARHIPWKIRVLDKGPDVMFSVADLDKDDDSIEVISSQFFGKRVTLHSIQKGPRPRVVFERIIDNRCGSAFGSILADLGGCADSSGQQHSRCVIDSGSTVGSIKTGDTFSHVLVTSHECSYADRVEETDSSRNEHEVKAGAVSSDGGSLFAYRVPEGKSAWKTDPWIRTTVATGFKVHGQLGNMINPGAPGFVYTFHAKKQDIGSNKQPMIAVAGDCAESAFIFRPESLSRDQRTETNIVDASTRYKLMMEIQCGATVGSIGVGYDDFLAEEESGYAKLYIPCYEKDKVLVFSLGSGEMDLDDGW